MASSSKEIDSVDNMGNYQFEDDDSDASDDKKSNDDDEFFVERILMSKNEKKKGELFLIKWRGFGVDDCTWEPIGNLEDVLDMVEEFKHTVLPKVKTGIKTKANGSPIFDWKRAKIVGTQKSPVDKKRTEYLIKWDGYPLETWEPKKTVPKELLRVFEKSPSKPATTPSKKRKRTDDDDDDDDVAEDTDNRPVAPPAKKTRSAKRAKTVAHKSSTPPTTSTPATPSKTTAAPITIDDEASEASTSNNKEQQPEEKQTPPSPTEIPFIMPAASQGIVRYNEKQPARIDGTKRLDKVLQARVVWLSTITHTFVPLAEIRASHPQELIDYLLSRMIHTQDFKRDESSNNNNTNTTSTTTPTTTSSATMTLDAPETPATITTTSTAEKSNNDNASLEQPVQQEQEQSPQQEKQQDASADAQTEKAVEHAPRSESPDI